jgi:hypothetical protein
VNKNKLRLVVSSRDGTTEDEAESYNNPKCRIPSRELQVNVFVDPHPRKTES